MRLEAGADVAAGRAAVFDRLADVDGLLAALGLGGATLHRIDGPGPARPGSEWRGTVELNGLARPLAARIVAMEPPGRMVLAAEAAGLGLEAAVTLAERGADACGMRVVAELRPLSLGGRMALRALHLAQGSLQRKLEARVARFARLLGDADRGA